MVSTSGIRRKWKVSLDFVNTHVYLFIFYQAGRPGDAKEIDGKQSDDSPMDSKQEQVEDGENDDGPWYFGRAREDFLRRRSRQDQAQGQPPSVHQEEDPIQVCNTIT